MAEHGVEQEEVDKEVAAANEAKARAQAEAHERRKAVMQPVEADHPLTKFARVFDGSSG